MDLQIKKIKNYSEILDKLVNLAAPLAAIKYLREYSNFIALEINTSPKSDLGAYFSEDNYNKGNYTIKIYSRSNALNEVFIPLELIDTIYGL